MIQENRGNRIKLFLRLIDDLDMYVEFETQVLRASRYGSHCFFFVAFLSFVVDVYITFTQVLTQFPIAVFFSFMLFFFNTFQIQKVLDGPKWFGPRSYFSPIGAKLSSAKLLAACLQATVFAQLIWEFGLQRTGARFGNFLNFPAYSVLPSIHK